MTDIMLSVAITVNILDIMLEIALLQMRKCVESVAVPTRLTSVHQQNANVLIVCGTITNNVIIMLLISSALR